MAGYINEWNVCIEYMTANTRFNLSVDCPHNLITYEIREKIAKYLQGNKLLSFNCLELTHTDHILYIHDGSKKIKKKSTRRYLLEYMSKFMQNSTGETDEIIKNAVINEYTGKGNSRPWRLLFNNMTEKSKYKVLVVVFTLIDKSDVPCIDVDSAWDKLTHEVMRFGYSVVHCFHI